MNPPERAQLAAFLLGMPSPHALSIAQAAIDENLANFYLARLHEDKIQLPDSPEIKLLQKHARANLGIDSLQNEAAKTIAKALQAEGIKAIWLKGTVFGQTIYNNSSYRQREDLDLIVRLEDFLQAKTVLEGLGYDSLDTEVLNTLERLNHHIHFVHKRFPVLHVELHHQLLGQKKKHWLSNDHIQAWLAEADSFYLDGIELFCLKPEAQLLYQCAHGFLQHGASSLKLRDYLDLHLLVSSYHLDYERIVSEAIELKWTYLLREALLITNQYFGTDLPSGILEKLEAVRPSDEDISQIILRSEGDIRAESVFQILGQLNRSERLAFLFALVFPSENYMRERYQIPAEKSVLPWYIYRWLDQFRGMILSALQRLRYRFWS